AEYAAGVSISEVDRRQIEAEKARIYAPVKRNNGMDWKELNAGVCRIMQDYCGELKNEELLNLGLRWLNELENGEMKTAYARNPHELGRMLEVFNIATVARMIFEGCRARKATNPYLGFIRTDYPQVDPPEWRKWITIRLDGNEVKTGDMPLDYYGDLSKNYAEHAPK
ncbi:MAG: hypothetical protein NUV31_06890, partial [Dehalococcoidales bacterium]|nr:hypothetical protein [Dehalococcoidales bacterium]